MESRLGEGSRFIVSLPIDAAPQQVVQPPQVAESAVRHCRVLLVDDDPLQLDMTAAMCRRAGIEAACCDDPAYVVQEDGSVLVDGTYSVDDFMEEMGIVACDELQKENFDTLSGLSMFLLGRIPETGDRFDYRHLSFEIVQMNASCVAKLRVTNREKAAAETAADR